jgi:hypothetical protein
MKPNPEGAEQAAKEIRCKHCNRRLERHREPGDFGGYDHYLHIGGDLFCFPEDTLRHSEAEPVEDEELSNEQKSELRIAENRHAAWVLKAAASGEKEDWDRAGELADRVTELRSKLKPITMAEESEVLTQAKLDAKRITVTTSGFTGGQEERPYRQLAHMCSCGHTTDGHELMKGKCCACPCRQFDGHPLVTEPPSVGQELPPLRFEYSDLKAKKEWEADIKDVYTNHVPVSWYACRERQLLEWKARAEAAESELASLREQNEELARKLAVIFDQSCYSDSLGVPGSDFTVCRWCGGGSSPGRGDFKHKDACLMDNDALEEKVSHVWEK